MSFGVDNSRLGGYLAHTLSGASAAARLSFCGTGPARRRASRSGDAMKIKNSLKSLRSRHRANRLVRRKGRVYIINKQAPRFKARQG